MIKSPVLRWIWLIALAFLMLGNTAHAIKHLQAISNGQTLHHFDAVGMDGSSCEHCCLEHAHSPAILNVNGFKISTQPIDFASCISKVYPEAPIIEFEYPPQLS